MITDEMLRVVAKTFFSDAEGDEDYPYKTWQEQFKFFKTQLAAGNISAEFIVQVYDWNKGRFEGDMN